MILSDNTWYLLNVFVQSIGYYAQYIIGFGLHTGAFLQSESTKGDKLENWLKDNTIYYCKEYIILMHSDNVSFWILVEIVLIRTDFHNPQ